MSWPIPDVDAIFCPNLDIFIVFYTSTEIRGVKKYNHLATDLYLRIAAAALEYLSTLKYQPDEIRFDVIGIIWRKGEKPGISHIESAFIVEDY